MISLTGIGSLPGTDFTGALAFTSDFDLPWLPELPERGWPSTMIPRTQAWLPLALPDLQKAKSQWAWDLDELSAQYSSFQGDFKVQMVGPWTLVAFSQLPRGQKVLQDFGAVRDYQQALADGVIEFLQELRNRMPKANLILQLDEPALMLVQEGKIATAGGFLNYPAIDPQIIASRFKDLVQGILQAIEIPIFLHSCDTLPNSASWYRDLGITGLACGWNLAKPEFWLAAKEAGLALTLGISPSRLADISGLAREIINTLELMQTPKLSLSSSCGTANLNPKANYQLYRNLGNLKMELADKLS